MKGRTAAPQVTDGSIVVGRESGGKKPPLTASAAGRDTVPPYSEGSGGDGRRKGERVSDEAGTPKNDSRTPWPF